MKHGLTLQKLNQGILRRLYRTKTAVLRAISRRPTEEQQLTRRIHRRVKELGRWYEDGNSDLVEYTYHPIPFAGFEGVKCHRGDMQGRLDAIMAALQPVRGDWILDIGANVGYFSFSLERHGTLVEAYESNSATFEIGAALSRLHQTNVIYINKPFGTPAVAYLRPRYRAVLLLSVFHWIVKQEGAEAAAELLRTLAARADLIFFETPCTVAEGMFQHSIFESQANVEAYLRQTLPDACLQKLAADESWGDRNLYCIHTLSGPPR
jgi:hypothetical protein